MRKEKETNSTDYATDIRKARRKTGLKTQEFFTPSELVEKMCDKIPMEDWRDPQKTFLEPCFGNGNFLVAIIRRKIENGSSWIQALETTYGVELMEDNVREAKDRIVKLINDEEGFNEEKARQIMDHNLVCSDFFKWDFENWKPME